MVRFEHFITAQLWCELNAHGNCSVFVVNDNTKYKYAYGLPVGVLTQPVVD